MVRPLASSHLSTFLLDVLLKGAVLLLLAHVASALLRRWEAPASLRRAAWGLAFAALLALPIGQMVLPQSSLPDPVDEVVRLADGDTYGLDERPLDMAYRVDVEAGTFAVDPYRAE